MDGENLIFCYPLILSRTSLGLILPIGKTATYPAREYLDHSAPNSAHSSPKDKRFTPELYILSSFLSVSDSSILLKALNKQICFA